MSKALDVFCEITCLTEKSSLLNGIALQKKWFKSADKRIIGQYLQKFVSYNSDLFNFLGVQPYVVGADKNTSLVFRSSEFIGTIPLRASDTGKQIGDFVVMPKFSGHNRFEDYIEILNLLGSKISPHVIDSLPLASGGNFRPPLYLEAIKFIASLESLIKTSWKKFDSTEKITPQPLGQVNWNKYISNEYKIEERLRYPVRKSILSELHNEYSQIRYVFDICNKELLSPNTPKRIKTSIISRLAFIEEKLYMHKPKATNIIIIKSADIPAIKYCKKQANKILKYNFIDSTAWRVDFSDVFEKFVQFIFNKVEKDVGGHLFSNYKIHSSKKQAYYPWMLKYIEPDAIFNKGDILIFIDAKYKSNLYNKNSNSETLKDEHRRDLHQIMAYSSFSKSRFKYGMLCYPSDRVEIKKTTYTNGINDTKNTILICGIPLKKSSINETRKLLANEIYDIEKRRASQAAEFSS